MIADGRIHLAEIDEQVVHCLDAADGRMAWRFQAAPVDRDELLATRDAMTARGPDGSGLWIASDHSIGLGHRRHDYRHQ